eukprot:COSAG01_NODE_2118_length_8383_cov_12.185780_7_plen_90_part_00
MHIYVCPCRGTEDCNNARRRGDYFGELALLTQGGQRAVTVEAVGPVHCLRLGRGPFDGLIAKNQVRPSIGRVHWRDLVPAWRQCSLAAC